MRPEVYGSPLRTAGPPGSGPENVHLVRIWQASSRRRRARPGRCHGTCAWRESVTPPRWDSSPAEGPVCPVPGARPRRGLGSGGSAPASTERQARPDPDASATGPARWLVSGGSGMGLLGTAFVRRRPAERLPRSFRAPGAQLRRRRERGAHPGLAGPPSGVEACVRRTRSTSGRSVARRPAGLVRPTHGTGKLTLRELLPSDRDVDRMHALPTMPARSIGPERRLPSASSRVAERSSRTPSPRGGPRRDSPFRSASASGQLAPGEHEQAAGGPAGGGPAPCPARAATRRSGRPAIAGGWRTCGRRPRGPWPRGPPFRPARLGA
jgi:hypothetical protein